MAITGAQRKRLLEALVAAFPTEIALRQLTQFGLDHPLERITTASGLDAKVFEVLEWAAAEGRLDLMVKGAHGINPSNPVLDGFLRALSPGWSFDVPEGVVDAGALPPGYDIKGWRIDRRLGAGGMGTVYAASEPRGTPHALKVLHAPVEGELTDRAFEEELAAAVELCGELNQGVAKVRTGGVDVALRRRWLVMDLVKGESLRAKVAAGGRMSPDAALAVVAQVVDVLAEAHGHAKVIVHCDLKPENVFVHHTNARKKLAVTVLDFGAARLVAEGGGRRSALGTPLYAAPEQWDDGAVRPAADVWALGLLVFYMLTGEDFWRGAYVDRLVAEAHERDAVAASARAAACGVVLPESFDGWFARCVAREVSGRFQEAGAALEALEEVVAGWKGRAAVLPARAKVAVAWREELPEAAVIARKERDAGMTLARWVAANGTMAPQWVAWVLATIADQLAVLRTIEGVHGTLEPDRIALDLDAKGAIVGARVVDLEARAVRSGRSSQGRTATLGLKRSTLRYVSLRVLAEEVPYDDVWSMGMIAYEAITGRAFAEGLSLAERVKPPSAAARAKAQGAEVPEWFEGWFGQCVAGSGFADAVTCGRAAWNAASGMTAGATEGWHGEVMPEGVRRAEEQEHAGKKRYWCRGAVVGDVLMVWVPPGEFWRGSDAGEADEKPRHRCTITKGLYVGVFPVTVEEYRRVVAGHPGELRHPVGSVSWNDAQAFCAKVGFRLLTEAEWERAARGSDGRVYPWGDEAPTAAHAWFGKGWAAGPCDVGMHPQGASPYGVEDLAGNVWEWCSDWLEPYALDAIVDPSGAASGSFRVLRGGDWNDVAYDVRATGRYTGVPGRRHAGLGFRLARGQ
jgi:serine/threonine protein kinase